MKQLDVLNLELTDDKDFTYLTAAASSAGTTLTVQSISQFAVNKVLLIGEWKGEDSEIIKTHAPTGTTIPLASGLVFDHPIDTKVWILDYNQVEFSHAATAAGSKSVLSTKNIEADQEYTSYQDSTKNSGFYFTRFKNDITPTYSDYSDPIPYGGYGWNTVFKIKQNALKSVGEEIGDLITDEFLNEALWEARREVHDAQERWAFRKEYNYNLGNIAIGEYRIALPSDINSSATARDVFGVRLGDNENMDYIDKKDWDEEYKDSKHTTVATQFVVGATTAVLTDSSDFEDSGTIEIGISGDVEEITYTANNRSTNTLSGIPASGNGSITTAHAVDTDVWQDKSFGLPDKYTVWDGHIYFSCPVDEDYENRNIWIDYYQGLTVYDSDADELDEPEVNLYIHYLAYRIKKLKNQGVLSMSDTDYVKWSRGKNNLIRKNKLMQNIRMIPDIP